MPVPPIFSSIPKLFSSSLVPLGLGFIGGILTAFAQGWVGEFFRKREDNRNEVKIFFGKVIDLVAVVTSANYSLRPNEADKRNIQRAAFHLEKLGKTSLANHVRSYMNKWIDVYTSLNPSPFKVPISKEEEYRILNLTKDLDVLTDLILKGK